MQTTGAQEAISKVQTDAAPNKAALQEIIKGKFEAFDLENKGVVDEKDVGAIVRSLGINPTEEDLTLLIAEMKDEIQDAEDYDEKIKYEKFEARMLAVLMENRYQRDSEERIRAAFAVLDVEKKGYIEPEKLVGLLSTQGEPFTQEEIAALLSDAVDSDKGVIFYDDYAKVLASD